MDFAGYLATAIALLSVVAMAVWLEKNNESLNRSIEEMSLLEETSEDPD